MLKKHSSSEEFRRLRPSTKRKMSHALLEEAKAGPTIGMVVNGMPAYQSTKRRTTLDVGIATLTNASLLSPVYTSQKTNNISEIFLNAIGISAIESERGYTLLSNPESAENLNKTVVDYEKEDKYNNPNILDNDEYNFLKSENITIEYSFPNENDPFYVLDNSTSVYHSRRYEKELKKAQKSDLINIGSQMTLINLYNKDPLKKLKYFDGLEVRRALKRSKF